MIKDPLPLYAMGLREAVLVLEQRDSDYSLEKVCEYTSRYLEGKGFHQNGGHMVVGIGANKGGVGKSTVAINLGHAFARAGLRTGIIDTDIDDPNDVLYVYQDIPGLSVDENGIIDWKNRANLVDVVLGRKVDGKRSLQRRTLAEVGMQSRSKPSLTYFLSEELGDSLGSRGNSAEAIQAAQSTLLKEARNLEGYHVVILDFPAGTPEYLSSYIGCDERGYVVDFKNKASFSGIFNVARLVARRRIDGNNFLFINMIPEDAHRQRLQDYSAKINPILERLVQKLGQDDPMRKAQQLAPGTNSLLKQLGLERLAFDERPAFLRRLGVVERSTDDGMPYLATLSKVEERSFGYSREMFTLATNMFDSYLKKMEEKVREKKQNDTITAKS